jgi:NAD(P)-dependent dehydrogenase (short-subunit alcohol dehydrogenase family)
VSIPTFSLGGKVAIVTGARGGIGKEIALTFAEAGADVAVCDLVVEDGQLETVAREIQQLGRRSLALHTDVRKKADVDSLVQKTMDEFGGIDILVNNAAIQQKGLLLEFPEDDWDKIVDTDLKGCFLCSQAVGKRMVEGRKGGNIINIASINSVRPFMKSGPYSSAKVALVMLTETLALELAGDNIRVNAVAPGLVRTRMSESEAEIMVGRDPEAMEEYFKQWVAKAPLHRMGQASDIAAAALFLASDAASYITGILILVDGGFRLVGP